VKNKTWLNLLTANRLRDLAEDAAARNGILGRLLPLTYDSDPLIAWRAVEAVGLTASRIAPSNPDAVRNFLRRLHWLLNDESGGVCWRAPEVMAEIVRHHPDQFPDYVVIVIHFLGQLDEDLAPFKAGVLWAAGRLAPLALKEIESRISALTSCLEDPSPEVRGFAAWTLGRAGRADLLKGRDGLMKDEGELDLYQDGHLVRRRVSDVARGAIEGAAPRA
jgi:hypothetical protein